MNISRSISISIAGVDSGPPPLPEPSTVNYTGAQYEPGLTGSVSTTKTAGRIYMRGALTLWSGWITGTEAKLTTPSDFGDNDGSVQVAINGGAFTLAPRNASVYTLFTGLSHAKRFVEVRYDAQMGDAPYVSVAGTALTVTGQPPALEVLPNRVQNGVRNSTGFYNGAQVANMATFSPPIQAEKGQNYGSNIGSVKLRGAFTKLVVTLNGDTRVGVSKNGELPTYYSITSADPWAIRSMTIPCDGSTSTYYVWDDGNGRVLGGHFAVAGDSTLLDIGTTSALDQFGDSITYGSGPGATSVDTETMAVAAALGRVGSTNGISGLTIAGLKTLLDTVLPLKTVTSADAVVLAIGGNSAADGIDSTDQADYNICIDKLKAKGYGKVICRGILPNVAAQSIVDAANAVLKSVVLARADPSVVWIDTPTWAFSTEDGTHPDKPGYVPTLRSYAIPAYAAVL